MEEFLTRLFDQTQVPVFSAFILGLMTAISPCPLATNIAAIGYISKDLQDRRHVFINGLIYTAGRMLSYTLLAIILYFGASRFKVSGVFQQYGEKIIGPLLIIIGLFMLDVLKLNLSLFGGASRRLESRKSWTWWSVLLLGIVFALAFCPYSGVLYFGMLIPMTLSTPSGLFLPIVFAVATGIPVILFAWFLAFSISGLGNFYNKLKTFEVWFRRVVAVLFIGVGIYYIIVIYF
ncbi:MAG: aromatic aminobenezylarsenical efflux permease ArsG family transporter [Bacteroidales bacterium]|nr:aromatic aminobenezylarsenical efflux permease ArsG family transporter [Bacteroidales bacterium]